MRRKLFNDLRVGDRICARVRNVGIMSLELEMVCMQARFRRCLTDLNLPTVQLEYDRSQTTFRLSDFVSVVLIEVDPAEEKLTVEVASEKAIIHPSQLPLYYRQKIMHQEKQEECRNDSCRMRHNPNLGAQLGMCLNTPHSFVSELAGRNFAAMESAIAIKQRQAHNLAMKHVMKGAELTKEGRHFEATQCFNNALAVDETCVDALVGRGAASANEKNFKAALSDLEKALELEPTHKNALRYRIEVLIAAGKELEKEAKISEARQQYERAVALSDDSRAKAALDRLLRPSNEHNGRRVDVIDLTDEDGSSHRRMKPQVGPEDHAKNKRKLHELEDFIATLKKTK